MSIECRTACMAAVLICSMLSVAGAQEAAPPDWLAQADARIAQHRMGRFTIRVVDQRGKPVPGAKVNATMTRHAFPFGTVMRSKDIAEPTPEVEPYLKHAGELFNRGTFGNYMKWRWQEQAKNRERVDKSLRWMNDRDWTVHAHVMIWATPKWGPPLPPDVANKLKGEDADRAAYIRRRSLEHIAEVGRYYRGRVAEWDVINEHFSEHVISEAIDGKDAPIEQAQVLVDWLKAARKADPHAKLFINDFGILVGNKADHKDSYEKTIRFLLERGAPLDGIGMQAHYVHGGQRRSPEQLLHTLDRFAKLGVEIQITEFDMFGEGWGETQDEIDTAQAEYMRRFYITCYSHPAVTGITMWGFWDGRHWMKNAPLFRKDWTPKPGLGVYRQLVFGDWWTKRTDAADQTGELSFRGTFGRYHLTATSGEASVERTVALKADGQAITLVIKQQRS